ncbi:protein-glutamate O-methyltransferase CheR [Allobacillus halotolerans]|uniref:Protein-glutamate O-methyltransferase CheR n=1 Tax=Allobacillus halotolerans TaxID=570278 RepID=A0ABS6GJV7_9BACI|nr:protein-glutamate O-methyltransferase CheR [Allobacillus halotolerans]MBU6079514.1 protein-glutamate O-methyltransferase CheR [Allobacillus halotolerans]
MALYRYYLYNKKYYRYRRVKVVGNDYTEFVRSIKQQTGIDLGLYKEKQMKRRLTSLRDKRGFDTFSGYFDAVKNNRDLLTELLDRMTINVSEFFRNRSRWDRLKFNLLPELIKDKNQINVWSAACSTGEEPYTLAILLHEFLRWDQMKILATDLDETVLHKAQQGIYHERSLKEVTTGQKRKYFHQNSQVFQVNNALKEVISFKQHNLLADPYTGMYDLICCRNVLIYFTDEAKTKIYTQFANHLKQGGILFVGSTEQIFQPEKYGLQAIDSFFYQKV